MEASVLLAWWEGQTSRVAAKNKTAAEVEAPELHHDDRHKKAQTMMNYRTTTRMNRQSFEATGVS